MTGVSESSQQSSSLKDEGVISISVLIFVHNVAPKLPTLILAIC
ncbi:hypothetical protein ACK3F5_18385 [Photorhabdus asymbiotica UENP]